jgi:hypothetical protein
MAKITVHNGPSDRNDPATAPTRKPKTTTAEPADVSPAVLPDAAPDGELVETPAAGEPGEEVPAAGADGTVHVVEDTAPLAEDTAPKRRRKAG